MKNIIFFLISVLILFSCKKDFSSSNIMPGEKYKIVATVGMVSDIVKNVAGDKADVLGIIGEGVDPHLYNPTTNDVRELLNADVIFYSGLLLEGKMSDILKKISNFGKPVNAVTELIDKNYLLMPDGATGHPDPHVWMDVSAWTKSVKVVEKVLIKYDPENALYYKANSKNYIENLIKLHEYAKKSIQSIPEKKRVLITAHDAFSYFGKAYELDVLGIQGLSTESEAGLGDINSLIDLIISRDIEAIFVESSVSDKNIKALIEGAEARGTQLKIGGTLFSDAMGESGTYEGTYIGMIDHNVTIIVNALGGNAPIKGLNGKLSGFHE